MVRPLHDFLHTKEVEDGVKLQLREEGVINWSTKCTPDVHQRFLKYFAKQQAEMYIGYDHGVDMKKDSFLESLSAEEEKKFRKKMVKIWQSEDKYRGTSFAWYMILEGKKADGESKVKLFQDKDVFMNERDEEFNTKWGWSHKGCWFRDLEDAKNYIQMARDEEGVHWEWPQDIPVVWKKGPLNECDMDTWGKNMLWGKMDFEEEEPSIR